MRLLKHIGAQPFIFATGAAALLHSTWSLGTLFAGKQPDPAIDMMAYLGWLIPAALIAFALDVGQIATSAEIRDGQRSPWKFVTFAVFAVATYFLQWLYIAHHMPALELGTGVRPDWVAGAQLFRDMALWFIPALLPLSTLLYTLSTGTPRSEVQPQPVPVVEPVADLTMPALMEPEVQPDPVVVSEVAQIGSDGEIVYRNEVVATDQPVAVKTLAVQPPQQGGAMRVAGVKPLIRKRCEYEKCNQWFETTNKHKKYCKRSHSAMQSKLAR